LLSQKDQVSFFNMKFPSIGAVPLLLLAILASFAEASSLRRKLIEGDGAVILNHGSAVGPLEFAKKGVTKLFVLEEIELGDTIHCITDADEGDVDLFLRFNAPPIPDADGQGGRHTCDNMEYDSEESCLIKATQGNEERVYVLLLAYMPTHNATLTCHVTPTTFIVRGVPIDVSVDQEHDALFRLDMEEGEAVECIASGEEDIDLYLSVGGIPDPRQQEYNCRSALSNNQTEFCSLPAVSGNTKLFVYLDAWGADVEKATLTCTTVKSLQLDEEFTVTSEPLEERIYRIDVDRPTSISCWANSSSYLDLSMVLDEIPNEDNILRSSSCQSTGTSSMCQLNVLDGSSSVFVKLLGGNGTIPQSTLEIRLYCAANLDSFLNQDVAVSKELVP
jgi:hypothetical protein